MSVGVIEGGYSEKFSKFLVKSIAFHVAVVAVFVVKMVFIPSSEPIEFESAVRVDIVDLPTKVTAPPQELTPPAEIEKPPTPEIKTKAKPIENTVILKRDARKAALEKLKALEKLNDDSEAQKAKPTIYKGNILSAGSALKGVSKAQYSAYLESLNKHVKNNWRLPQWLAESKSKAKAVVFCDASGRITRRELVVSSGNPTFDEYVIDAIDKSNPLPRPPEKFTEIIQHRGILLGFPE